MEGKDQLSQPAGDTLPNTAKDNISLPSSKGTLLTHCPQHVLGPGIVPPQVQDSALLVELHEVFVSPPLHLPRSLWMAALGTPTSSVLSMDLLRVYSTSSSRWLMKMLNKTGTQLLPCKHKNPFLTLPICHISDIKRTLHTGKPVG